LARLRLRTRVYPENLTYAGTGEKIPVPTLRLFIALNFVAPDQQPHWRPSKEVNQLRRFDAVVDTGAMLTNIPYEIWEPFASEIRWPYSESTDVRVAGITLSYHLGRVMLAALDNDNRWMPPAWTLARCWHYKEDAPSPLLGLTSPFLTNNRNLRHVGPAGKDISERPPEWWLEDPLW